MEDKEKFGLKKEEEKKKLNEITCLKEKIKQLEDELKI